MHFINEVRTYTYSRRVRVRRFIDDYFSSILYCHTMMRACMFYDYNNVINIM